MAVFAANGTKCGAALPESVATSGGVCTYCGQIFVPETAPVTSKIADELSELRREQEALRPRKASPGTEKAVMWTFLPAMLFFPLIPALGFVRDLGLTLALMGGVLLIGKWRRRGERPKKS